jgi:hypothetical protein
LALIFCATVGLASYPGFIGALRPAVATAIVIGLLQQARQLLTWRPAEIETSNGLAFARQFAITWRLLLAVVLSGKLLVDFLAYHELILLPEHEQPWVLFVLHYAILDVGVILALSNSVVRWRSESPIQVGRTWRTAMLWTIVLFAGLIAVIDTQTITYLVEGVREFTGCR